MKTLAIVGGGASGMLAGITALETNPDIQVIIFDQKDILGKKILSTGNGRCNLTNKNMSLDYFRSDEPQLISSVLKAFGYSDTIRFFENLGLLMKSRNGYIYPRCDQASVKVIIIPLFYEMKSFNLTDSLIPLMLIPIFCSQGAISAFMFRQFFVTVPKELEEAARLDGLNHFGIFRYVMFPISMPVASSAGILAFLATWNTYLEPLVFTTSITKYTLPLSLNNFNDVYGQPEWHLQLAATTLSVVPVMIVYLIFQEKVTDAMVNSGMKG